MRRSLGMALPVLFVVVIMLVTAKARGYFQVVDWWQREPEQALLGVVEAIRDGDWETVAGAADPETVEILQGWLPSMTPGALGRLFVQFSDDHQTMYGLFGDLQGSNAALLILERRDGGWRLSEVDLSDPEPGPEWWTQNGMEDRWKRLQDWKW